MAHKVHLGQQFDDFSALVLSFSLDRRAKSRTLSIGGPTGPDESFDIVMVFLKTKSKKIISKKKSADDIKAWKITQYALR